PAPAIPLASDWLCASPPLQYNKLAAAIDNRGNHGITRFIVISFLFLDTNKTVLTSRLVGRFSDSGDLQRVAKCGAKWLACLKSFHDVGNLALIVLHVCRPAQIVVRFGLARFEVRTRPSLKGFVLGIFRVK